VERLFRDPRQRCHSTREGRRPGRPLGAGTGVSLSLHRKAGWPGGVTLSA
jgi:hypothetical protein